jgi:molecular chaperone GrpE
MKKRSKPPEAEEASPSPETPPSAEDARDPRDTSGGASDGDRVARERDEYLASWQRATADYQNLRRRVQDDIESAVASRKKALLTELLLVLDYLDMALSTPVKTDEGRQLHAGVEATRQALLGALERAGVRPVPEGGRFDPSVHESVARAEGDERDPAWKPGEIVATLRRGYTLDGKMLRPAQVRVAGGLEEAVAHDADGDLGDESRASQKPETD